MLLLLWRPVVHNRTTETETLAPITATTSRHVIFPRRLEDTLPTPTVSLARATTVLRVPTERLPLLPDHAIRSGGLTRATVAALPGMGAAVHRLVRFPRTTQDLIQVSVHTERGVATSRIVAEIVHLVDMAMRSVIIDRSASDLVEVPMGGVRPRSVIFRQVSESTSVPTSSTTRIVALSRAVEQALRFDDSLVGVTAVSRWVQDEVLVTVEEVRPRRPGLERVIRLYISAVEGADVLVDATEVLA